MVVFPGSKINLGLHILSKLPDSYHSIETGFYPVPFTDVLEIIPADSLSFSFSGEHIPGREEDNLCMKAYSLLKKDFAIPPIKLHLHKIIPPGAGLGGGSSDAAMTLRALNQLFGLEIGVEDLRKYAASLGSDCAFFIETGPMLGTGRGDILTPLPITLRGKYVELINPGIPISTAEAYRQTHPVTPDLSLRDVLQRPLSEWSRTLTNDFESSIFQRYPELKRIKQKLYERGAVYASLSGSGSTVYGLFEETPKVAGDRVVWAGRLP